MYFSSGTNVKRSNDSRAMDAPRSLRLGFPSVSRLFERALHEIRRSNTSPPEKSLQNSSVVKDANVPSRGRSTPCHKKYFEPISDAVLSAQSTPSQFKNTSAPGKEYGDQFADAILRTKSRPTEFENSSTPDKDYVDQSSSLDPLNSKKQIEEIKNSEMAFPRHSTYPTCQYQDKEVHNLFPNKSVCQLPADDIYSLPIMAASQSSSSVINESSSLNDSIDYSLPVMCVVQPEVLNMLRKEDFIEIKPSTDYSALSISLLQLTVSKKMSLLDSPEDYSLPITQDCDFSLSDQLYSTNSTLSSGYTSSYDSDISVDSRPDSSSNSTSEEDNVYFFDDTLSPSQQMDSPCPQELSPEDDLITPEEMPNFKSKTHITSTNRISSQATHNFPSTCESCESDEIFYSREDRLRRRTSRNSILPRYDAVRLLTLKSESGFIDSHCHLDFLFQRQNYEGTYEEYQKLHKDTFPNAYMGCVAVFCNPFSFIKRAKWGKYLAETNVWAAFGCHPHNAEDYCDSHEIFLSYALEHTRVKALGEIGLDYSSRNNCSKEIQHLVFRRQLKIAMAMKLPVVIHCRDAHKDTMMILKEVLPKDYKIHLHCFADEWKYASEWLETFPNLYIGITNVVTFQSADDVHEVAKNIPLNRLLLETDAPYFVPRVYSKGTKWSHPGMAIHVAAQIAELKDSTVDEVLHWTRKNTMEMYGI